MNQYNATLIFFILSLLVQKVFCDSEVTTLLGIVEKYFEFSLM